MYIVAIHDIKSEAAFERGQLLIQGVDAPEGTRALQFYPSQDGGTVACLWEGSSVESVQTYVDQTLGDTSLNTVYAINAEASFAERPLGLSPAPSLAG